MHVFLVDFVLSYQFPFAFPFVVGKDGKTCLNAEKNDFNQQTACRASIPWLKYTTPAHLSFSTQYLMVVLSKLRCNMIKTFLCLIEKGGKLLRWWQELQ